MTRRVLDYLIRGCKIDLAEHLCSVFGLDMQKLLELAGDEQFNRGQYAAGGKLHQLAKVITTSEIFALNHYQLLLSLLLGVSVEVGIRR